MTLLNAGRARTLVVLLCGAVLGSIATVLAQSLEKRSPSTAFIVAEAPHEEVSIVQSDVVATESEADLEQTRMELSAALARIDELYREREREWVLNAAWIESLLDARAPRSSAQTAALERVRRKLEIRAQAESGQLLAGLDDALMLMFATLLAGEEAIKDLCDVVRNDALDLEMRQHALASLGYLPSEYSLDLILNPPDALTMDEQYLPERRIGDLALLVDFLPRDSVNPHTTRLYGLATEALNRNAEDNDAWRLVAALGFEHDNADALRLLNDPRNTNFHGGDLLTIAWWAGTDTSRKYIERLSRTHPDQSIRQTAIDILASWPAD